jgi:glycosyltransferase involved in cell wall biosynthesis
MAAARPRVGVGLPVYNGERFLSATLDSLLAQTHGEFVLLIGDNASTDGTEEIARDYAARDPRIEYIRHPVNIGAARNYNQLFQLAGTEYFRWHAADDLSLPEYTARCVEVLDSDAQVALAYCKTTDIDQDGGEIGPYEDNVHTPQDRARDRFFQVLTVLQRCNALYGLMRSTLVERTRLLEPFIASDFCFMSELALYGKFIEIPERLFLRRYHAGASSALTDEERVTFNSARRAAPSLRAMRHWWAHWSATIRVPLPWTEKAQLQLDMLKYAYWSKADMAREAGKVLRFRLGFRQVH